MLSYNGPVNHLIKWGWKQKFFLESSTSQAVPAAASATRRPTEAKACTETAFAFPMMADGQAASPHGGADQKIKRPGGHVEKWSRLTCRRPPRGPRSPPAIPGGGWSVPAAPATAWRTPGPTAGEAAVSREAAAQPGLPPPAFPQLTAGDEPGRPRVRLPGAAGGSPRRAGPVKGAAGRRVLRAADPPV